MGRTGAFLEVARQEHMTKDPKQRIGDFDEVTIPLGAALQCEQASRCMDCGVGFCQSGIVFLEARTSTGCPLHNPIPETNALLCQGRVKDAAQRLAQSNPFPEFTGRVCPAPCETACNLGLHDDPVTIHDNERAISDYEWSRGMPKPFPVPSPDAKLVSVIGSGPAGLAAAWKLVQRGYRIKVYEREDRLGGLLTYGIPAMKLPKPVVERRIELMKKSGVEFIVNCDAAKIVDEIADCSDAIIVACGTYNARKLELEGCDLDGIVYALDYLKESTKAVLDNRVPSIDARGKNVVVIGGGDTGVDCMAVALRQGAKSVKQVIRASRPADNTGDRFETWPNSIAAYSMAYGHEEAASVFGNDPRIWSHDTLGFTGTGVIEGVRIKSKIEDSDECVLDADLVLIAKGFIGPEKSTVEAFNLLDGGTEVMLGTCPVFIAGDARTGSSIVANAIADGMSVAGEVIDHLN